MSIQRCRTCARCAGGRRCSFQDGDTKGCSNYTARINPYARKKVEPKNQETNTDENWAAYKKVKTDVNLPDEGK